MKVKKEDLHDLAKEILQKIADAEAEPASPRDSAVERLRAGSHQATIIALRGDLGAGKTTFTQVLAAELGIEEPIQSPTYVLMKSYPISFKGFTKLVHIDAYRLEKPEEFAALKPEQFLNDREALVVIEWPERVEGFLPTPNILLNFSHTDTEGERHIEIKG